MLPGMRQDRILPMYCDMTEVLAAKRVSKAFADGERFLGVLNALTLSVKQGERVAVLGRSGSGKSTMLHVLAGLMDADEGEVIVAAENMTAASAPGRAKIRNRHMGFVYQFHHLLPEFNALENVALPLLIRDRSQYRLAFDKAERILRSVGMQDRLTHLPHQLSGGEKQRVAVSRAMVCEPSVVLGDEVTANLDAENANSVLQLIDQFSADTTTAFLLVTHDLGVAQRMDRVLALEEGKLRASLD